MVVITMSLGFIFFVTVLHVIAKVLIAYACSWS